LRGSVTCNYYRRTQSPATKAKPSIPGALGKAIKMICQIETSQKILPILNGHGSMTTGWESILKEAGSR